MDNITLHEAIEKLKNRRAKDADENNQLYFDNHLQKENNYRGYIGVLPSVSDKQYAFVTNWLERIFTASNLVKSSVGRNLDGVLSREPDWSLVFPKETSETEADTLTEETDEVLIDWWNERDAVKNILREAGRVCLLEGEAYLRPIIPVSLRSENGLFQFQPTLSDGVGLIDFEILTSDQAGIFVDRETGKKFSVCLLESGKTKEVELSWIDENKLTNLKILRADDLKQYAATTFPTLANYISALDVDPETQSQPIDLGGRLYLHRVTRDQLITETARALQRSLNYSLTTMNKNLNIAGSRETSYGNAQRPKIVTQTKDADGIVTATRLEDAPVVKGSSNENFLIGVPIYDPERQDSNGNPILVDYKPVQQFVVDPVAVDTFIKAFETYRVLFLDEVNQAHVLMNENATASGKSRQESRNEFKTSLKSSKIAIDPAGRYVLEIVLKFGAALCNREQDFTNTRFDFNCQITAGVIDLEEIKQEAADVEKGYSSLFDYLVKKGIEDPDAAIARIKAADGYLLSQLDTALTIYQKSNNAIPLGAIIGLLPISDEQKAEIMDNLTAAVEIVG